MFILDDDVDEDDLVEEGNEWEYSIDRESHLPQIESKLKEIEEELDMTKYTFSMEKWNGDYRCNVKTVKETTDEEDELAARYSFGKEIVAWFENEDEDTCNFFAGRNMY